MSGTVFVGCKMPRGPVLNLDFHEKPERPGEQGARGNKSPDPDRPVTVTLNGTATTRDKKRFGDLRLVGGYAISEVDEGFWSEWVRHVGPNHPFLRDRLIFALPKPQETEAKAKSLKGVPELFAPLKPLAQEKDLTESDKRRGVLAQSPTG